MHTQRDDAGARQRAGMPGVIALPTTSGKSKSWSARSRARPNRPRARTQFDSMQRVQIRKALLLAGALGVVALALGFTLAWWAGRRVHGRSPR